MNKKEIEKEYINHMDIYFKNWKDGLSNLFIKRLGVITIPIGFLFSIKVLTANVIGYSILLFIAPLFLYLLHTNTLDRKFFSDSYCSYINSIKSNNVLNFKIEKRTLLEKIIDYKYKNELN